MRRSQARMVGLIRWSHNQAQNFMFKSSVAAGAIRPSPGQSVGAMHPAPGRPPSYPQGDRSLSGQAIWSFQASHADTRHIAAVMIN